MPMATKEEQVEYQKKWMARRRKNWFNNNGPCRRCWSYENLEIHHLDPAVKETHRIWSWSEKRRNEELKKCVVLCEKCHGLVHAHLYREKVVRTTSHGTEKMYSSVLNCRCPVCKYAHMMHMRTYRRGESEDSSIIYNPEVMQRKTCWS